MRPLLFDWPWAGLILAAVLAAVLLRDLRGAGPRVWEDPRWVLGWLWPVYLLHQFEEHGIDVLGRRYAFLAALCGMLG